MAIRNIVGTIIRKRINVIDKVNSSIEFYNEKKRILKHASVFKNRLDMH